MLRVFKSFTLGLIITLGGVLNSSAQINISPYSLNGLGDLNTSGLATNIGMGGIGISNGQPWYLNNLNPALLVKNTFTVLEAGMVYESRNISESSGLTQNNSGGGLNYFAMSFPIMSGKWSSSIGLMPYSTVNYNILSEGTVNGAPDVPISTNFRGEGGLTQAFFSNGFRLTKSLSLGVKTTLLFGSLKKESFGAPGDENSVVNFQSYILDQTSITGFTFSTGFHYAIPIKKNTFLNTGFNYNFSSNLNAKQTKRAELRSGSGLVPISSNIILDNLKGNVSLPSGYSFGISYEKLYKLVIGADFHVYNWSNYRNFEQNSEALVDNMGLNVGAEYTPDATSVDSYFARVVYRLGVEYQKTPFEAQNQQLNDFGINFGASFPMKGLSAMNLAFKFGQRGTTDNNLLKENYFRVHFGVSFNDRWFQRRVLN